MKELDEEMNAVRMDLAVVEDIQQIISIKQRVWPQEPARIGHIQSTLTHPQHAVVAARWNGNLVGFADGFITCAAMGSAALGSRSAGGSPGLPGAWVGDPAGGSQPGRPVRRKRRADRSRIGAIWIMLPASGCLPDVDFLKFHRNWRYMFQQEAVTFGLAKREKDISLMFRPSAIGACGWRKG